MQYLKENLKDEVDFFSADKHERFLQIDIIILGMHGQACPNCPKKQVCNFVAISNKERSDEVDFLLANKYKSFLQIDTDFLWEWSSIPKVPKIASLQYL